VSLLFSRFCVLATNPTHARMHTRENRGFSVVKSTLKSIPSLLRFHTRLILILFSSSRVFWYAMLESIGIIGMAVYVLSPTAPFPFTRYSMHVYIPH